MFHSTFAMLPFRRVNPISCKTHVDPLPDLVNSLSHAQLQLKGQSYLALTPTILPSLCHSFHRYKSTSNDGNNFEWKPAAAAVVHSHAPVQLQQTAARAPSFTPLRLPLAQHRLGCHSELLNTFAVCFVY